MQTIEKRKNGSRSSDYKNLVHNFDGKNIICFQTEMEILEIDVLAYFFGVLTKKAAENFAKELNADLNYGQVYDKFVKKTSWNKNGTSIMVLDIPKSLVLANFIRIANSYFTEKEKQLISIMLTYNFDFEYDKEYMEVSFLAGLFSNNNFN